MLRKLSRWIDKCSSFFAPRKGLLPLIGMLLIIANFIAQLVFNGWLVDTNFLLHLGLIISIFGFMLAWAL
jgi:hypothetical protein